ncbi:DUF4160 domain-containing protein [Desulfobacter latus]|uniref:DUF4160 domain-containing protein n=1 Tax=Desulfobacter latus TaxID=2292 RepID=A0A850TCW7_9BACT|nr:DUF4160 domain-containing protein [Desulfobacter latus]NWH06107.1 DUF4160 domain-containing protein [Desulfobacter latus]
MPTVFKIGPYRFFFYSGDRDEPVHVHVEKEDKVAKFWLEPVRLQRSSGFRAREINDIQKKIQDNQEQIIEAWNEYFND